MSKFKIFRQYSLTVNIFRTVHFRIILVDNQLDAQIFYNTFIYSNSVHV